MFIHSGTAVYAATSRYDRETEGKFTNISQTYYMITVIF